MTSIKTLRKFISLFLILSLQAPYVFSAPNSFIWFQTQHGQFKIPAIEKKGRIRVDVLKLSESLGAGTRVSNGIYVMQFSSETIKINPATDIFSLKEFKTTQWKHVQLKDKSQVDEERLYVTLESLPVLLNQSFTYHLQRRTLSVGSGPKPTEVKGFKNIPMRFVSKDQKIWLSVEDLAKALGVVIYSLRVGSYSLVLPDFTILDLNVGQQSVLRRRQPYKQLYDPVLAFSGSPYVTLASVNSIFEIDVRWDPVSKTALIPSDYGRLRDVQVTEVPKLVSIGYRPEPFDFKISEFSSYYQEPGPTYVSGHNQPYESVRDFLTALPIPKNQDGFDQVSGHSVAEMGGSLAGAPLSARGSFEKVGSTSRAVNGGFSWGFPLLTLEGGREYMTFSGLSNQFELVDQVSVSHANDHYGEGKLDTNWQTKVLYGETTFDVYSSTELFTQTVLVDQSIVQGSLGSSWKISPNQQWGVKLDHYLFKNKIKDIQSSYLSQELIDILLGSGISIDVDPAEELALARTVVSDNHSASILDLNYSLKNKVELQGTIGASNYKDEGGTGESIYDTDWKVRTLLGRKQRIEVSYESVGDRYRSVGNPFAYQGKQILRVAPYLALTKWWRFFGDSRREDINESPSQGIKAYTTKYQSAINVFSFQKNVVRLSGNQYDSTLYGKRIGGNLDLTQYLGPNSVDVGVGQTVQYGVTEQIFRRSSSGKLSFLLARPNWKFSMGEEYTRHQYVTLENRGRYESLSNILIQVGGFRTLLQYEIEPRYYYEPEYLYTGYIRMGHQVGDKKYFDLFYSAASLRDNLSDPEVWRVGFEFTTDLF